MNITDRQSVFDAIKAADHDNTLLWALTSQITSQAQSLEASVDIDESKAHALFDNPDKARAWWLQNMQKMTEQGNQQAAKSLQDALGIVSASNELSIELIDYANMIIECPHCQRNVHEPVIDATDALTEG